jgi:REP element-mobilizing transposase RayT
MGAHDVPQPPSVAPHDVPQPPSAAPRAKPAKSSYRRNLPHIHGPGRTLFVTFSTWQKLALIPEARGLVLLHCLHDNGTKLAMHAVVVMPDHVHLLFTPLTDNEGTHFGIAEIMSGIKGASAHSVNRLLGRRGRLWNVESYDHVVRLNKGVRDTAAYICRNPVRAGLVAAEDDYPRLWREWVEGSVE